MFDGRFPMISYESWNGAANKHLIHFESPETPARLVTVPPNLRVDLFLFALFAKNLYLLNHDTSI